MDRGFIFSLDAFVAFTLIMFTIGLLIFTIGTPGPFYPSLEQAQSLAHDTLLVLANSPYPGSPGGQTYLGYILANPSDHSPFYSTAGGHFSGAGDPGIIPLGFGYRLEKYVFGPAGEGSWKTVYDAGTDTLSNRYGKSFTKVQASAGTILSVYDTPPRRGKSFYCYKNCNGFDVKAPDYTPANCSMTPCSPPPNTFGPGNSTIQMVRLVVYT